jgi:hypothetical protein
VRPERDVPMSPPVPHVHVEVGSVRVGSLHLWYAHPMLKLGGSSSSAANGESSRGVYQLRVSPPISFAVTPPIQALAPRPFSMPALKRIPHSFTLSGV